MKVFGCQISRFLMGEDYVGFRVEAENLEEAVRKIRRKLGDLPKLLAEQKAEDQKRYESGTAAGEAVRRAG